MPEKSNCRGIYTVILGPITAKNMAHFILAIFKNTMCSESIQNTIIHVHTLNIYNVTINTRPYTTNLEKIAVSYSCYSIA